MSKSVLRSSAVLIGKHKVQRLIFQRAEFIPCAINPFFKKQSVFFGVQRPRDKMERNSFVQN